MRLEDLNWMDVEEYLKHDDRLIIVVGACEQHGFLSLLSDVKIPLALADAISTKTGVLVAPPVNFGASPYFIAYPGTLSLRLSTLMDILEDIVRSAHHQGFRRFLILNGHGGNTGSKLRLSELANELSGLKVQWYAWWLAHSLEEIAMKNGYKPTHANWLEAFPFTMVADLPREPKTPPHIPADILDAAATREVYGDGSFGGPYQAPPELMTAIFEACQADIIHLLDFN
jgi:creatinine amidohydrolase